MDLNTHLQSVKSKEGLVNFVDVLQKDLSENPNNWENSNLINYLNARAGWVRGAGQGSWELILD